MKYEERKPYEHLIKTDDAEGWKEVQYEWEEKLQSFEEDFDPYFIPYFRRYKKILKIVKSELPDCPNPYQLAIEFSKGFWDFKKEMEQYNN